MGWPPNVTRAQRHGDLLSIRDDWLDARERAEKAEA